MRESEELDVARVDAFLKARIPGLEGTPRIGQFARGASNLTYLLAYPGRDLVLRRPPFGHEAKGAHDMVREARVMQALRPAYPVVPEVLAVGDDPAVMGWDFFVMERIAGIIPRQDLPAGLGFDAAMTRRLCVNVIDKLVELDAIDPQAAGSGGDPAHEDCPEKRLGCTRGCCRWERSLPPSSPRVIPRSLQSVSGSCSW